MLTIVMAAYGQPKMLGKWWETLTSYPKEVTSRLNLIVVDDCGDPPAEIPKEVCELLEVRLFRVVKNINWNQMGARNLGVQMSKEGPCLLCDPDMIFPNEMMKRLVDASHNMVPGTVIKYGLRHMNNPRELDMTSPSTYVIHRQDFMACGGMDEDYAGHKGWSDVQLLDILRALYKVKPRTDLFADFYSVDQIPDAMVTSLDRSTKHNKNIRIRKVREKNVVGGWKRWVKEKKGPNIRFPWEEVCLKEPKILA